MDRSEEDQEGDRTQTVAVLTARAIVAPVLIPLTPYSLNSPVRSLAIRGRPTTRRWLRRAPVLGALLSLLLSGCAFGPAHYLRLDQTLLAGDFQAADALVAKAEDEYGTKNRVLYGMDRGVTLQLLGDYRASNEALSAAEDEVERLFTRRLRHEALAWLTNDNELPFEGDPFEQVMINVEKALNYALLQQWQEALVEARRIDHRLNVIADRASDGSGYRDDGFARYLTGLLYEIGGDLNNAMVAYRRAIDAYGAMRSWNGLGVPAGLRRDALRAAEGLGLTIELQELRQLFPDTLWQPIGAQSRLAQVIVISYNGRAPVRTDQFLDVPLSLDAARLVLLSRGYGGGQGRTRTTDSLLYGLNGRIVRIALPQLIPQRSAVTASQVAVTGTQGTDVSVRVMTEPVQNITALADKALKERMTGITVRASARAAIKFGVAEAVEQAIRGGSKRGDRRRDRAQDDAEWIAFVAGALLKTAAAATEEADKRSWRTLPDSIQIARLWVPAGTYDVRLQPIGHAAGPSRGEAVRHLTLQEGETRFIVDRVLP